MPPALEIPIAMQTLFADLVERAWTGNPADLTVTGGTAYAREVKGRRYWYWQPATKREGRPSAHYIGPDNDQTRARLQALTDHAGNLRQRRDMVRALRAARLPAPDAMTGNILAAMAEAACSVCARLWLGRWRSNPTAACSAFISRPP